MRESCQRCLIVDSDANNRVFLREALASADFPALVYASSIEAGLTRIEQSEPLDIVFVSQEFGDTEIARFISKGKERFNGRDAAFILLIRKEAGSCAIGTGLLQGADGFLLQPYSVESLEDTARLAERVKKERHAARMRGAIMLLVQELGAQMDRIATMQKAGHAAALSRAVLQEMGSILRELDDESRSLYFELLAERFGQARPSLPARRAQVSTQYRGSSSRVSDIISAKALERVRRAFND